MSRYYQFHNQRYIYFNMKNLNITLSIFLLTSLFFLLSACSGDKTCPGCGGNGTFAFGESTFACQYCQGAGKISSEEYDFLTSKPKVSNEPVEVRKFCVICKGTGKFHAPQSFIVSDCNICNGTGVAVDERNNTTVSLYECIDCGGSGKSLWDGSSCKNCNGTGLSYMSVAEQINSGPAKTKGNLCGACGGKTVCPICRGNSTPNHGDINYCSACGNTRRCKWCYGRGY